MDSPGELPEAVFGPHAAALDDEAVGYLEDFEELKRVASLAKRADPAASSPALEDLHEVYKRRRAEACWLLSRRRRACLLRAGASPAARKLEPGSRPWWGKRRLG